MKRFVKIYTYWLLGILLFTGCDDYLKEDSGDLLIPGKVEEFLPMLYREGFPRNFNDEVAWLYLMTDDVEMGQLELDPEEESYETQDKNSLDALSAGEGEEPYKWEREIKNYADNFWERRYGNILACNLVIDALPEMKYVETDSGVYNFLAAQAYALRAYNYWCLVNSYALPWSKENLDKPGVIIRTEPQIDVSARGRSSIRDVYDLINGDIEKAEKYINVATFDGNIHRLSEPAILLLASRIALFQENWDEVIRTGKLFLAQNSVILNLNDQDTTLFGTEKGLSNKIFTMMDGTVNKEVVFTFGTASYSPYQYLSTSGAFYGLGFRPSHTTDESLIRSYEEGDLRKKAYFLKDIPAKKAESMWEEDKPYEYKYYYPIKYRQMSNVTSAKPSENLLHENWRSVEVMLNLAEAYTRKNNEVTSDALDLLNNLRRCRLNPKAYVEKTSADFPNAQALLKFIWEERRRELCFEEAMRFWDLRRQGMPELKHKWYSSWDRYETYTLPQGSKNYVLSIPRSELDYNNGCHDNERDLIRPE